MVPQVRGVISYYQSRESQSYRSNLRRLPYDDSCDSIQSVDYFANLSTKTAWMTYVSYRRNMAAVLSASLYRTLDALSRGPRLGMFQTIPQRLVLWSPSNAQPNPMDLLVWSVRFVVQLNINTISVWQEAHRSGVKTILKYLKMTKDIFLIYGGGELILEGYYDGSFQSDNDDVKSQLGFLFKLNGGVVAWKSSKQATTKIPPQKLNQ
ncbi:UNVERIFIED_CONTAM: Secreted RxLR effector protein [Sesamum angustifolium]|uniref:Secreted RxLR effector protein n=1 Tax=Sesamum angustifolium TaxID=2727405 RepID=A0AAW2KW27_9LAMI